MTDDELAIELQRFHSGLITTLGDAEPLIAALTSRLQSVEQAIRVHRDASGDDRCWMDDEALYGVLPEGYMPPARDSAVELAQCARFIATRQHPRTEYVSPEREIERLKAQIQAVEQEMDGRMVAGVYMDRSIADFQRSCEVHINEEQYKPNPDNALIALLCDAVRCSRELVRAAQVGILGPPVPACPQCLDTSDQPIR